MNCIRGAFIGFLALLATPFLLQAARADTEVDLALVLAVDVSRSMDPDEQDLQRQGFVDAFRSPLVHNAIREGSLGRISVIYMEWSGRIRPEGRHSLDAHRRRGKRARIFRPAVACADRGASSRHRSRAPSLSRRSFWNFSGVEPIRRVIDVSGDGPNSSGRNVIFARDEAVAKGITINGLPIMLKRPSGFGDMENLDQYYRDCVIGGSGAFLGPGPRAAAIRRSDQDQDHPRNRRPRDPRARPARPGRPAPRLLEPAQSAQLRALIRGPRDEKGAMLGPRCSAQDPRAKPEDGLRRAVRRAPRTRSRYRTPAARTPLGRRCARAHSPGKSAHRRG